MKRKYQMQQIGESGSVARYAVVAEGVSEAKNATSIEQQYGRIPVSLVPERLEMLHILLS